MKIFSWSDRSAVEFVINSFNLETQYRFPRHSHKNHWEFVYCEQGELEQRVNDKSVNMSEGDFLLIRETDIHSLKARVLKYHNIAFSGAWIEKMKKFLSEDFPKALLESRDPPLVSIPLSERKQLLKRIEHLIGVGNSSERNLEFSSFLFSAFDTLVKGSRTENFSESIPLWLQETLAFIHNGDQGFPSIQDVTDRSCRSAEHMSRSFRKYLGVTPTSYLMALKLKKAAELLRNTNFPVKEICYLCSYKNANYFHRQFREQYKMTPAEYRVANSRFIH